VLLCRALPLSFRADDITANINASLADINRTVGGNKVFAFMLTAAAEAAMPESVVFQPGAQRRSLRILAFNHHRFIHVQHSGLVVVASCQISSSVAMVIHQSIESGTQ